MIYRIPIDIHRGQRTQGLFDIESEAIRREKVLSMNLKTCMRAAIGTYCAAHRPSTIASDGLSQVRRRAECIHACCFPVSAANASFALADLTGFEHASSGRHAASRTRICPCTLSRSVLYRSMTPLPCAEDVLPAGSRWHQLWMFQNPIFE